MLAADAVAGRDKQAGKEDRAHRRLHAHGERVVVDLGIQEDDADSLAGLQGFENVLVRCARTVSLAVSALQELRMYYEYGPGCHTDVL